MTINEINLSGGFQYFSNTDFHLPSTYLKTKGTATDVVTPNYRKKIISNEDSNSNSLFEYKYKEVYIPRLFIYNTGKQYFNKDNSDIPSDFTGPLAVIVFSNTSKDLQNGEYAIYCSSVTSNSSTTNSDTLISAIEEKDENGVLKNITIPYTNIGSFKNGILTFNNNEYIECKNNFILYLLNDNDGDGSFINNHNCYRLDRRSFYYDGIHSEDLLSNTYTFSIGTGSYSGNETKISWDGSSIFLSKSIESDGNYILDKYCCSDLGIGSSHFDYA